MKLLSKNTLHRFPHAPFLLCTVGALLLHSQVPDTLWTKTYGGTGHDYGYSVIQTHDSHYLLVGYTSSFGAGGEDYYLIKADLNGDTLWTRTYGGQSYDRAYSVIQASDLDYVIAGFTESFGVGGSDVYLIKTDSDGDTLWTKTYGDVENDCGYAVIETPDGGYAITGFTCGIGGANVYLIKTDSLGDTLWTKTYGGAELDDGRSIVTTSGNGYLIAGTTFSFGAGGYDIYLIRTDSLGDTLWTKTYGGSNNDYGYSVTVANGGYVIVGATRTNGIGTEDIYLIRINNNGDTLWTMTYGGVDADYGYSVSSTPDECYIIVGKTSSFGAGNDDLYLLKVDSSGNPLWTRAYGGTDDDFGYSVVVTLDTGYIVTGSTYSFGSACWDVWLLKIAPETGLTEHMTVCREKNCYNPTVFSGPLLLPVGKKCKVFDITGRVVVPQHIKPGIYFIEIDGVITKKVVKVR
jgi:hypothetical protein